MDRRNRLFRELRESGLIEPGSPGLAITAALQPIESEPVITKSRVGAFTGTELDELLWAHDIETLLIAGATTSRRSADDGSPGVRSGLPVGCAQRRLCRWRCRVA
ncbi:isochorismatase family protein [Pseudomonas aeruginosa]